MCELGFIVFVFFFFMNVYIEECLIFGFVGQIDLLIDQLDIVLCGLVLIGYLYLLFGGIKDNKVVQMLVCIFVGLGYVMVCLNFCGVGKIEGMYDNGIGEQDDMFVVFDWMCM